MQSLPNQNTLDQLRENQNERFDENMAIHTLIGNLTHWRSNFLDNKAKMKVLVGRMRILNLIDRFKV